MDVGLRGWKKWRRQFAYRFPWVFTLRVWQMRCQRWLTDWWSGIRFASRQSDTALEHPCTRHQSLLLRKLGDSDPKLQANKIINLGLAIRSLAGLRIGPGETFSFWERVGSPSASRGYVIGMQLSRGEVREGVGGGLCQLANLLYWMALHTPLQVVERHHHSFDPFPDDQRALPFGSGAGVFYNYIDLRFYNPTGFTFHLEVWLTDKHLKGRILSDQLCPYTYKVEERKHRFERGSDGVYRSNELWRRVIERATGQDLRQEMLMANCSLVKYPVEESQLTPPEPHK